MKAILLLLVLSGVAIAQGGEPGFGDLPANPSERDLSAVVRSLVARVTELERRVNELEAAGANRLVAGHAPATDPEAQRLLATATAHRSTLARHLDGFELVDPTDGRLRSSRVKPDVRWETAVADAQRFADALKAAVGKAAGLPAESKSTLESQIRWARGRTIYQVKRLVNITKHVLLPLDFGTDVLPADEKK